MSILYITWDGPQTTYLESLFLPIFARLRMAGFSFHVIQLTWGSRERIRQRAEACRAAGVPYRAIRIARSLRVFGQLLALGWGAIVVRRYARVHGIDILMPRGPLAGWIAFAARRRDEPLVYDADGLMIDERVEFGGLREGSLAHQTMRNIETKVAGVADQIVCRTSFGRSVMIDRAGGVHAGDRIRVVGNGRDPDVFRPTGDAERRAVRAKLGIAADAPLVVYAGSLGPQYCLAEMAAFFRSTVVRRSDARWLVLSRDGAGARELQRLCGPDGSRVVIAAFAAGDVPMHLAAADIALSFRARSFSMRAVAPIKVGEYLLCGVPTLTSDSESEGGPLRAVDPVARQSLAAAADWLTHAIIPNRDTWRESARALGLERFCLDQTVSGYAEVLSSLGQNGSR